MWYDIYSITRSDLFVKKGRRVMQRNLEEVFSVQDIWHTLAASDKHIVMYGMGNGADKIIAACARFGIEVEDFFASDGFVRGQSFHGKRVMTFAEVCEKYGKDNMIVLISFASALPDVMAQVARVADVCETYIPEVPVRGDVLFTAEYAREHREELMRAHGLLADERSREVFFGVVMFRLTGKLEWLQATEDAREIVMQRVLHPTDYRAYCDVGAYDGETVRELISLSPQLERVWAIEPDRRNYRKLAAYAEGVCDIELTLCPCAAWDREEILLFDDSGNRNAGYDPEARRRAEVQGRAVDTILVGAAVDYIKYDVEGSEAQALRGSVNTIRTYQPDLLVSLYHRTEDLHELILQIHEISPDYRLYLRRYPYIPAWDLNLYASVK